MTPDAYDVVPPGEYNRHLKEWAERNHTDEDAFVKRAVGQIRAYLAVAGDPDAVHEASTPSLGGYKPPPKKYVTRKEPLNSSFGFPYPTAITLNNYPRLVRASNVQEGSPWGKKQRQGISQAISDLHEWQDDDVVLMSKILDVTNTYALLDPFDEHADTLQGWKKAIAEVRFYFELLEEHNGAEDAEKPMKYLANMKDWLERRTDGCIMLSENWFFALAGSPSPKIFKERLGEALWRRFAARAKHRITPGLGPDLPTGGLWASCGSLGWAYQELRSFLHGERRVVECGVCKRLFTAVKSNAKTCPGSRCKMRKSREKSRETA
jgi:hypothetical protein